ncbi:hypothetical protein VIGAN_08064900 [Vigna angularis var. angularis]|uniref:FAE domain-containing protein n=1 Tax=Vigna angularis var. angularis TaxID=157739 RepID=A0A0S3SML9_PHAAN|nr:hypothetical protein VIGAN_08064900 [Vigna angularis var. angularis]
MTPHSLPQGYDTLHEVMTPHSLLQGYDHPPRGYDTSFTFIGLRHPPRAELADGVPRVFMGVEAVREMTEKRSSTSIYLLDFSCYHPPNHLTVHFQKFIHHSTLTSDFLPPHHAREEAEQVMFGTLDNLFANTRVKPKDIGILVVNPTPSLSCFTLSFSL